MNRYKCPLCSKSFGRRSSFSRHKRTHLKTKSHHCMICKKAFFRLDHLKKHLSVHAPSKFYTKCKKFGGEEVFSELKSLKLNSHSHQAVKTIKCNICQNTFLDEAALTNHISKGKNCKAMKMCQHCGKYYVRIDFYIKHIENHKKPTFKSKKSSTQNVRNIRIKNFDNPCGPKVIVEKMLYHPDEMHQQILERYENPFKN